VLANAHNETVLSTGLMVATMSFTQFKLKNNHNERGRKET